MKNSAKVKSLEKIEIRHDDWYMILQGLKLKETELRENAFYRGHDNSEKREKLYDLLARVSRIVDLTSPPSIHNYPYERPTSHRI